MPRYRTDPFRKKGIVSSPNGEDIDFANTKSLKIGGKTFYGTGGKKLPKSVPTGDDASERVNAEAVNALITILKERFGL